MNEGLSLWPDELADRIAKIAGKHAIDGVTFSGGEPMHQAGSLLSSFVEIRHRLPGLSFGMFSGYSLAELDAGTYMSVTEPLVDEKVAIWYHIRAYLDFGILGRFDCTQPVRDRPLVTSANQQLYLFTNRYTLADFAPLTTEVTIDPGGSGTITGFPILGSPVRL